MVAKRFVKENFNADDNEYEIRYAGDQQYSCVTKDMALMAFEKHLGGTYTIAGIRYRPLGSTASHTLVNTKDYEVFYNTLKGADDDEAPAEEAEEPETPERECQCTAPAVPEAVEEVEEDGELAIETGVEMVPCEPEPEGHTEFRFCCYEMMHAMLGGLGLSVNMDTGKIQIGTSDIRFCPYCSQSIITHEPPRRD